MYIYLRKNIIFNKNTYNNFGNYYVLDPDIIEWGEADGVAVMCGQPQENTTHVLEEQGIYRSYGGMLPLLFYLFKMIFHF